MPAQPTPLLTRILAEIDRVPPLPQVASRVLKLIDDPESSAAEIAKTIQLDQGLTLQLLRMANSAYYGLAQEIKTVQRAVASLGLKQVKSIVVTLSTRGMLAKGLAGYAMDQGELWRHSLSTAILAEAVAKASRYKDPDAAFVAGLLHDVGKTIVSQYLDADMREVLVERVTSDGIAFNEVELDILGADHGHVGSLVTAKWGLWPGLVEAIGYHHKPQDPAIEHDRHLVQVVHVGDALSLMLGQGLGVDGLGYALDEQAVAALGLDEAQLTLLVDRAAGTLEAAMREFMAGANA